MHTPAVGLFNAEEADRAKQQGMKRVAAGARKEWLDAALDVVQSIAKAQSRLTPDDVWQALDRSRDLFIAKGIGEVRDRRALGPVMVMAAERGYIEQEPSGKKLKSLRPERHAGDTGIWWSLIAPETRVQYLKRRISEQNEDALFADGFEGALIGAARQFNRLLALYDRRRCISILIKGGLSHEEAEEYFEFNVAGAYVGENTPLFHEDFLDEDE